MNMALYSTATLHIYFQWSKSAAVGWVIPLASSPLSLYQTDSNFLQPLDLWDLDCNYLDHKDWSLWWSFYCVLICENGHHIETMDACISSSYLCCKHEEWDFPSWNACSIK